MDELKQILTYKLKIMHNIKDRSTLLSSQEKQQQIEQLLKQKRKQTSRQVIQSRLLQSLSSRKIEAPYRLQQFFNESLHLMQLYSSAFNYNGKSKGDTIMNIVELYIQFFNAQDCSRRAEEIKNIYEKSLCERGTMIPTIFNWFAEWLRKVFKDFIKKTLHELSDDKISYSQNNENKKTRKLKFIEQINEQKASLSIINSQIKLFKQKQLKLSLSVNKSKLLSPSPETKIRTQRVVSKAETINKNQQEPNSAKLIKLLPIQATQRESSITNRQSTLGREKQKQKVIYLNKDIFFSAFYEEFTNYYKFYSGIEDLDDGYPRSFRKVDRREEISKNLGILIKSMVKNQPADIKNSIERYCFHYEAKFGKIIQKQIKSEQNIIKIQKKPKKRSESVNIKKQKTEYDEKKNDLSLDHIKSHEISEQKKHSLTSSIEIDRKKTDLQLPAINQRSSFKSTEKILLVHHNGEVPTNRYANLKNESKQRISAEIYKELHEINNLFRSKKNKNSKQSAIVIGRSSFEQKNLSFSPLRFNRSNHQNIQQYLEGNYQPDGIFRLPKILK